MKSEGERKRKKFNLLKILQIAPVHNSPKLPTNQGRVPITLPLHGDQITLWICVQREREREREKEGEEGRGRERERDRDGDGGRRREKRQPHSDGKCTMMQRERDTGTRSHKQDTPFTEALAHTKKCFWCSVHKSRTTNRLCGCCKFETDKLWWCWQTKSRKGMCPEW